jgi:hypothetical protein
MNVRYKTYGTARLWHRPITHQTPPVLLLNNSTNTIKSEIIQKNDGGACRVIDRILEIQLVPHGVVVDHWK